jgi:diaminopropionate ammonia-lyase
MQWEGAEALREEMGLGPESQVLLVNTEGNTSPEEFRSVVWEGNLPVPAEYRFYAADQGLG